MSIRFVLALAIVVAISCVPPSTKTRRDPNIINAAEIANTQASNVYDVITRVRPAFLRSRGRTTINAGISDYPEVYMDGQRYGDIEQLKSLTVQGVRQIRYYNMSDATTKFGTGHTAGVIEVITRP